jgi:hypothetical protein
VIFLLYENAQKRHCNESNADGLHCRPRWLVEIFYPLDCLNVRLTEIGTFALVCYLAQCYSRYRAFYWNAREIQDAITNLALNVSNLCSMTDASKDFERRFERYLTLVHVLCYIGSSKESSPSKLMYELLPDLDSLASKGNNSNSRKGKEKDTDIMGLKLLNDEELKLLKNAQSVEKLEPTDIVLTWMVIAFDRAADSGAFRKSFYATSKEEWTEPSVRSASQCLSFVENTEKLRTAISKMRANLQFPIPLAYAHIMQIFADILCLLAPFSILYNVNTMIIEQSGYETSRGRGALWVCLLATWTITYLFQGIHALAKLFSFPFGYETAQVKPNTRISAPELLVRPALCT